MASEQVTTSRYSGFIRKAKDGEASILTTISFAAKNHWRYPAEYLRIWQDELTLDESYLKANLVFVYEVEQGPVAYYSLVELQDDLQTEILLLARGWWLEHMFIVPDYIGRGIGRDMFDHLSTFSARENIRRIDILADPNARGFYDKMGCRYLGEKASSIPGRTTPHFCYMTTPRTSSCSCGDAPDFLQN